LREAETKGTKFAADAGIVAAHSKIENRILHIISLPDFFKHSLTHREEIGDNANAGIADKIGFWSA
jgi:hypothetical protein